MTRGLTRISGSHRAALNRLAALFKLWRVEDLWNPDLIEFQVVKPGPDSEADLRTQLTWRQQEFWSHAKKLVRILASKKHDYLKDLIDTLYATIPQFETPDPDLACWSSSDMD